MKSIILLSAIALSITTVSCRKERVCECKTTSTEVRSNGNTYVSNSSTKLTKEKQSKKTFQNQQDCFSKSYSFNGEKGGVNGYTYVTTVEEKCEIN